MMMDTQRPSLAASIRRRQAEGLFPVIAEIKVRSDKEGDLLRGRDPVELARSMAALPVAGISVVTEPEHFGGSIDLLRAIAGAVDLPVLHKDFVMTKQQVEESADCGASAVLLIAAMLDEYSLAQRIDEAARRKLETLVEAHTPEELKLIRRLPGTLLGINNRNITIFEVDDGDVGRTEKLSLKDGDGRVLVSESAIAGPNDARRAGKSGADAVLVGTAVLQSSDPTAFLKSMIDVGWPP
ncbi:MAG TPA: indole-3-glycerol-phosphate synthase [Deltaproteobacteria bacterium]|nr:indole-3-glycerol-phosphate synthase [Deltaproteobacteria bacterium]